jgi:DNA polymerase I
MAHHLPSEHIDVLIVDAFSLLFRAFHAFPLSLTSPTGELTNAVYGFTRLLLTALRDWKPKYVVVATDKGKPTFRHQAYTAYKANREEAPNELKAQISRMYEILDALNIPTIGLEGYEADDVIGTLAVHLSEHHSDLLTGILTGDRDSFQLVDDHVAVVLPQRQNHDELALVHADDVVERMGVRPDQVIDYKALVGDASDNIPGVRGIGPKTAQALLTKFSTLDGIYTHLDQVATDFSPSVLKKLAEGQESAKLSQQLATIDTKVPFDYSLEAALVDHYDKTKAMALFDSLGFQSLKKALPADEFEGSVQASLFG